MVQVPHNGSINSFRACNRSWPVAVSSLVCRLNAVVLVLLPLLAAGCAAPAPPATVPGGTGILTVHFEGLRNDRGSVLVSLFAGARGFPDEVAAAVATVNTAIEAGRATTSFADLPYGEYAVSVLHDEDGDEEMATGLFGAPREGFGFSGNPDYRFGHPGYDQVRFLLVEPQREMTIVVRYETARRQHQDEGRAGESRRPPQE